MRGFRPILSIPAIAVCLGSPACESRIKLLGELAAPRAAIDGAPALTAAYSLANGADSIELTATPNRDATIHYAVYDVDPGPRTGAQVKAAASACSPPCRAAGSFAAAAAGGTTAIPALADQALYAVYAVAEEAGELAAEVKRYEGVLPRRNSMQSYGTALANGVGVGAKIRYAAYAPPGYYDQTATRFPVIMYVHGGGETVNNGANPDSDFTRMRQTPFSAAIAAGEDFPAIFVQPQCNDALWDCANVGSTNYLAEVIDRVNASFRTNPKRFSVIGMSWGGAGAFHLAYDYPQKVSAVMPLAGGLYYRSATSGALCPRFATTNRVALWPINNVHDPIYNPTSVPAGGGAYGDAVVATLAAQCAGGPDARFTDLNDNATFPLNFHGHLIAELVVNSPYWDYGNCSAGQGFKAWNGTTCVADADPPAYRVPRHPAIAAELAAASLALTGSPTTFATVYDWLTFFEKP